MTHATCFSIPTAWNQKTRTGVDHRSVWVRSEFMERRYALFIAISLGIILGGQLLQAKLFPKKPPAPPVQLGDLEPRPGVDDPAIEASDEVVGEVPKPSPSSVDKSGIDSTIDATATEEKKEPLHARIHAVLGSLDPSGESKMLVTLTSRGAAIERIELAGERFHDQEDRSGYLGHLALEGFDGKVRVGVVGMGTPAAAADIRQGDLIERVGQNVLKEPRDLVAALSGTKPGEIITLGIERNGMPIDCQVTLGWRPLEVVRPELNAKPVIDVDSQPSDPLSFLFSFERIGEKKRQPDQPEISGAELVDREWKTVVADDGKSVLFTRSLPAFDIEVSKEYRLVSNTADSGRTSPYRLELIVRIASIRGTTSVEYAIDGPTGLPTEGWWYTSRVSRDWGALAVRDVAVRFVGEQSTLISGMTLAAGSLDRPSSAVRDDKPLSFAGVDALYFASALIPRPEGPTAPLLDEVKPMMVGSVPVGEKRKLVNVTCRAISRRLDLLEKVPIEHAYDIFAGPKKPAVLSSFGIPGSAMDDLIYFGWFGWVARPMIAVLHGIHAVLGNYGIAIILLTVFVRGAMFPISRKQAISSQKMQELQPEMKIITEKYKNEPEKRTRATQELWKKHNYNPAGGCLLVFLQIPIFMGLYRSLATDVELRQAPLFSSWIRWCSNLAAPDMLYDWSPWMPGFLGAPEGWLGPFLNLFPLATIGLFLWQQKLFMPPAVDEQSRVQQQVMKYMMFFMALMFFKVPCGLCLYFIASSLWGIAERMILPKPSPVGTIVTNPASSQSKSTFSSIAKRLNGIGGASRSEESTQARRATRKKRR